ncbi:hypothetical protein [Chryseobacterium sp. SIMBA_029]|uniref:hypothetical protein n=1 Tax=Chryseobacterium sp. SIMBA_029 TaxID=3085772 RepID=UPI003979A8CF
MSNKYKNLTGKTKKEVLEIIQEDNINYFNSNRWIFYLGKVHFWQKEFLHLFFEEEKVILSRAVFKNCWNKKI